MSFTKGSFTVLDSVASTNNYAIRQIHEGLAKCGDAYFTSNQTAGKGQRGKTWQSTKGQNIALSVVIEPIQLKLAQQFQLSSLVALACSNFFEGLARDKMAIKWPNDIYWRDRKAGGILIENILRGDDWKWAIVGIGININQIDFDPTLPNPVSLQQITGKEFDVTELARELHTAVCNKMSMALSQPIEHILKEYNNCLYKANELVRLKKDTAVFETTIKGVNEKGQLLTKDVLERQFDFGEIEWVL